MIEAGHLHTRRFPRQTERKDGGVEQRHVAGVGDNAGVQRRVVGQRAVGAQPHLLIQRRLPGAAERVGSQVAQVDGPRAVVHFAHAVFERRHARFEVGQRLRGRHIERHWDLIVETRLRHVETGLQVENGFAVLDGDNAPGGEAAAVADAIDLVENRDIGVAWTQEVGVQRVHPAVGLHGASGRHQRLTGYLTTEYSLPVLVG